MTGLMNTIGSSSGDSGSSFSGAMAATKMRSAFVNLRRRQADTVVLVHGVDHVVDELLHRRVLQLRALDLPRAGAQHRMAHAGDLQQRHGVDYVNRPKAGS